MRAGIPHSVSTFSRGMTQIIDIKAKVDSRINDLKYKYNI